MPFRGNSATISILAAKGVDWIQAHHHLAARRTNQKPFATRHHQAMRLDDNFSAFSTLSHIAPESVVVHDKERAHGALVKAAKCTDEAYKADTSEPFYLEAMALVNNLCSWLRRYLFRFPRMKKANLQSYLNWFVYLFRVRHDEEKWPKTARVLRHLLMADAHYCSSR